MTSVRLRHICEVCGVEEILTPEDAYEAGWDYPPKMGVFGVIGPRTCGHCAANRTAWWAITFDGYTADTLTAKHKATIARILDEPASIAAP
ncbi:hypothetical protein ABIA30_005415 [Mycobacterium sp. MAA66]|uniref:hypothetical protein n=1 Tax=Mycobacterium sp. MAA66 TaxID=3156297 RepID=UPI003515E108